MDCGACGEHVGGGGKQRAELPPAAGAEGKVHLAGGLHNDPLELGEAGPLSVLVTALTPVPSITPGTARLATNVCAISVCGGSK